MNCGVNPSKGHEGGKEVKKSPCFAITKPDGSGYGENNCCCIAREGGIVREIKKPIRRVHKIGHILEGSGTKVKEVKQLNNATSYAQANSGTKDPPLVVLSLNYPFALKP
jgi:hypothetical protein